MSNVSVKDRMKFFRETSTTHTFITNIPVGIKNNIMNAGFTAVPGNFADFDEALTSFAEKVYFHSNTWKDADGTLLHNWDDPNNNNFYEAISSYAPPATVVARRNGIPDITSTIDKSFAFRPHKYSFSANGRYEITFEHDMDGDNSIVSAKAYLIEQDRIIYEKEFTLPTGTKKVTLDDICVTDRTTQELVLLVTRLDTDEGVKIGDYQFSNVVQVAPVAIFDANESYTDSPSTVQFTDMSRGTTVNWNWDLGDGNTSVAQNPKHEYKTSGQHTIKLKVDNCASEHTRTKYRFINVLPAYISRLEVLQNGQVIQTYTRQYNSASKSFSFTNSGTYAQENIDLVINVTTSLPLYFLELIITNENGSNSTPISPQKPTGTDTKNWSFTIPAVSDAIGPRLNTLKFSGNDYGSFDLIKIKEPEDQPVFIDKAGSGWNKDIVTSTGVDDNYLIYMKSASSAPEAQSRTLINSCDKNKVIITNNENATISVEFGDGSSENLAPYSYNEHTYTSLGGKYTIKILQGSTVKKTMYISFID